MEAPAKKASREAAKGAKKVDRNAKPLRLTFGARRPSDA
jgi:hypothetical protein